MSDSNSTPFMTHAANLDLVSDMAEVLRERLTARGIDKPAMIGMGCALCP